MPLDPYLRSLLERIAAAPREPSEREFHEIWSVDPAEWSVPAGVSIHEYVAAGAVSVPVRVYSPARPRALLVWVHGGGFAFGDLDMPEAHVVSAELAHRADALVVSVDYRLAGADSRYPDAIDDVETSVTWAIDRFPGLPLAVGGASAGAALALAATRRPSVGRHPSLLVLAYPFAHFPNPSPAPGDTDLSGLPGPLRFPPVKIEWMVENYVGRLHGIPADALPGAMDLAGLPPTFILSAEYDDLRPSAELLARQLRSAGVEVDEQLAAGAPHGILNRVPSVAAADDALDGLARAVRGIRDASGG